MKRNTALRKTVLTALMAALTAVATIIFQFPLPGNGYANLGDCFVILSAFLLGPLWGGLAAGIGAALSDLLLGFAIYAPATFVIKFLMAVAASLIIKKAADYNKTKSAVLTFISALIAEVIMVADYFVYELCLYGISVAALDIIGNSVQGAVGIASSLILFTVLIKTKAFANITKLIK